MDEIKKVKNFSRKQVLPQVERNSTIPDFMVKLKDLRHKDPARFSQFTESVYFKELFAAVESVRNYYLAKILGQIDEQHTNILRGQILGLNEVVNKMEKMCREDFSA